MGSGAYGWPSTRRCDTPRTGPSADRSPIAGTDRNRSGRTRPSNERPRPALVVLAELRSRCDAWHHDPAKLGYAEVVALLGDLSRGCETADQLRALVSPPAPASRSHVCSHPQAISRSTRQPKVGELKWQT